MAGDKITISGGKLSVPDQSHHALHRRRRHRARHLARPVRVFDAAVAEGLWRRAQIAWMEVFAGEKSFSSSTPGCPTRR